MFDYPSRKGRIPGLLDPESRSFPWLVRSGARRMHGLLGETAVGLAARRVDCGNRSGVVPGSILVLRNNDLGDVLVATPLFEALKRRFAEARVVAGVGDWARPVLAGNPFVDHVVPVNAPWWNKYSEGGCFSAVRYLLRSPEVRAIRLQHFDLGIDYLGSRWGALLLIRAGIPDRMAVRGFAGGHTGMTRTIDFSHTEHVADQGLRLAAALGATELPEPRPQLFLSKDELAEGERSWGNGRPRVVIAPGGGMEGKCWPRKRFAELVKRFCELPGLEVAVVVGPLERDWIGEGNGRGSSVRVVSPPLRELFAMVAAADLVVCNSSMVLHVAAAFRRPSLCLLGPAFRSVSAHDAQWGYPGLSTTLGREGDAHPDVATVEEALTVALAMLEGASV